MSKNNPRKHEGVDRCPACGGGFIDVTDSRMTSVGRKRRRKCPSCNHRWTTFELAADTARSVRQIHANMAQIHGLMAETLRMVQQLKAETVPIEPDEDC